MHNIRISAIIPTYNREYSVGSAIESVLSQTQPVDEIIIVDDGSIDNTSEVVRRFYSSKVTYIYQDNKGVSAALNRGIKAVGGNWIAILDSDDRWRKNKIEKQLHLVRQNNLIDFVHTNRTHLWANGKTETRSARTDWDFTSKEFLFACWATKQSTVLFRKSLIDKTGGLLREDLRTCQDYEFFWKLILCARHIGYVPEPVVDITMSDDGLSRTDTKINRTYDNITAMNSVINWIDNSGGGYIKYKKILAKRIIDEVRTIIGYRLKEKSRNDMLKDFLLLNKHINGANKVAVIKELMRKLINYKRIL